MELQHAINTIFVQLSGTLQQLSPQQYIQPCKTLFNNSVGQHVRHIIELYQCLEGGYESGTINYENRKRDRTIETDRDLADKLLLTINAGLNKNDKPLLLEANYDEDSSKGIVISTNYYREVAYNLEHTIHHMALIRIGIAEMSDIILPENFGVASSTVKYKKQCAQ